MAPPKSSKKGDLSSFVTKKKGKKAAETKTDDDDTSASSQSDEEVDEPIEKATTSKKNAWTPPDESDLPPINSVPEMFLDIVGREEKLKNVAEQVKGRKLRVATMCSGTESPLLALNLIFQSMERVYGVKLDFEHVFSCEIEPFKQAYIERNFSPPLLFRDVCQLGEDEANTAYGSLEPVPGDVDLLVAGTSCVDYSNLNNEKQDIDGNGESGRTFRGMMGWVKKHRPPIVILENVISAPWDRVAQYFKDNKYDAEFVTVDTKNYYIPHTRQRKYLFAVSRRKGAHTTDLPGEWKSMLQRLRRDASASLDAFLLSSDDPRIHQARQKLAEESYNSGDKRTGRTDWARCESRHQRARLEEELGSKRPLTSWEEGGSCKMPDYAWADWAAGQVERVWDLLDISLLRSARKGIDPSYKTEVWNLSQNVDRSQGSNKIGICPCLTPSMIPYIANRGGPMVGLEALSMQGLPIDQLLLTRESEDQLADLAGNAMSTTVVGTCIVAALVVAKDLLKSGDEGRTYEAISKNEDKGEARQLDDMDVDESDEPKLPNSISGVDELNEKPLDLYSSSSQLLSKLLADAENSARLCQCEGRTDVTKNELLRCSDCGTSTCVKCSGRPEHNTAPLKLANREWPSAFLKTLKEALPMCLSVANVTEEHLDHLKETSGLDIPTKRWESWRSAVVDAARHELRFVEVRRQEIWSVVYSSSTAVLQLFLHPKQPEWRLFAKPKVTESANAEIRRLLDIPIGRLTCSNKLLEGEWEIALPHTTAFDIKIQGVGEPVPSWGARLGLVGEEHRNALVHSQLKISISSSPAPKLDRDISGVYTLLPRCGTANAALHKRAGDSGADDGLPPLFMFLDPHRTNKAEDAFVFSTSTRRCEYRESRPIVCKLNASWRQSCSDKEEVVECFQPCQWVSSSRAVLQTPQGKSATFAAPGPSLDVSTSTDACGSSTAFLVCKVPEVSEAGPEWPRNQWVEVDKVHERATFKALAWLLEPVRNVYDDQSSDQSNDDQSDKKWTEVSLDADNLKCERCSPTPPEVKWVLGNGKKHIPMENHTQAGKYERGLKDRPSPFVTHLMLDQSNTGIVKVGINFATLMHRAYSRLPSDGRTDPATLSYRVATNFVPLISSRFDKFAILSNKKDKEHAQPPHFKIPLRVEQLRSLEWMIKQESKNAEPFIEEEVSEAILEPLGWRAEGRAQRPHLIRGGVLADQVGYGKTAITLGLIDCLKEDVKKEFEADKRRIPGKIRVEATLVIVPPHLTSQWESEVRKFSGKHFKVVVVSTATKIRTLSIDDIKDADIIVVASNLFRSDVYLENLQSFAGCRSLPSADGRHFNDSLAKSLEGLRKHTQLLRAKNGGSVAVLKSIREARQRCEEEDAAAAALLQSKRLKGKQYRDAVEAQNGDEDSDDSEEEEAEVKSKDWHAKPTRNGLVPEVLVPSRKSSAKSDTSSLLDSEEETLASDASAPRPKRKSAKVVIVDSDSDSEPEPPAKKAKPAKTKAKAKAKPVRKGKASAPPSSSSAASSQDDSDYEDGSAEESEAEAESDVMDVDDEEDSPPAKKTKTKAAPVKKPTKTKGSASSTDGESTKGTKRKAKKEISRPAKKRREENDPWKLESAAVKKDWNEMKSPPFEMFHFARIVVDEYTYLEGKVHALVTNLTAERHWVLSGTPPIHDFGALKTIAAFLHIHLGIDDDAEGRSSEVKKRRRDQSAAEKFHAFREVRSVDWHKRRHEHGQRFLNHYVRQNVAEIDEIPYDIWLRKVELPAAERAIYLELEHHLRALDMTIKRGKKTESDREKRLNQSLGESKTAEEALLKRCSHFDLDTSNDENAMKACDVIVDERQRQLDECKGELLKSLKKGVEREAQIRKAIPQADESIFNEYIRVNQSSGTGDVEATRIVCDLLKEAKAVAAKSSKSKDNSMTEKQKATVWEHREKTHEIRRLTKELVGRVRSLRYFTSVRDLQKKHKSPYRITCPACGRDDVSIEEGAILSSCGHSGCLECVKKSAAKEECVYGGEVGKCDSAARNINIVKASTLGVDDVARDGKGRHFGKKLEMIVDLIKNQVPKEERILVFVQFPDLMKKVAEALSHKKIEYLEIKGSATQKTNSLSEFQKENSKYRVLLLNVMDESASGANLTVANHAVFLSPLLAPSQEIYTACEIQAVGRLVRYGQTKNVSIWRFMSVSTIDEEIFELRDKEMLSKGDKETSEDSE